MKTFIKGFKTNTLITAIVFTVLGLFLVIFPGFASSIIGYVLGAGILVMGIITLITYFINLDSFLWYQFDFLIGLFETLIGLFILTHPGIILASIPFVFGLILFIHGIAGIGPAVEMKKYYPDSKRWISSLILAIVSMVLGFIIFSRPFGATEITLRIIGVCLLYDAITDFIALYRSNKAAKTLHRNADGSIEGYVDADFHDIK